MTYTPHPDRHIIEHGPSVGTYKGRDIPAWIKAASGRMADYVGICGPSVDLDTLAAGQSVIAPGLVYQDRQP
jgi:hypothetical protein